jgi:hypothetical protein
MFLAVDQYNQKHLLKTKFPRKELLGIFGTTSARKIYQDDKSGQSYHAGYLIRGLWLTLYRVSEFKK